jgi:hypothetical protein
VGLGAVTKDMESPLINYHYQRSNIMSTTPPREESVGLAVRESQNSATRRRPFSHRPFLILLASQTPLSARRASRSRARRKTEAVLNCYVVRHAALEPFAAEASCLGRIVYLSYWGHLDTQISDSRASAGSGASQSF